VAQRNQLMARIDQANARLATLTGDTSAFTPATSTAPNTPNTPNTPVTPPADQTAKAKPEVLYARAQVDELKATLAALDLEIAEGEVKAPSDSQVEVLAARPGDILPPNRPAAKLLASDQIWIRIFVPEPKLGRVQIKQRAAITVDTFPNEKFSGYVEQIAGSAEFFPRNVQTREDREYQVFRVKVHIDDNGNRLKPGMAAEVKLEAEK
jgi:HlyD family secretion protein